MEEYIFVVEDDTTDKLGKGTLRRGIQMKELLHSVED